MNRSISIYLFIVCGVASATYAMEERIFTPKGEGEWGIYSPSVARKINKDTGHVSDNPLGCLHTLSKKVHYAWNEKESILNLTGYFDMVFAPVNRAFLSKTIDQIVESPEILERITTDSYRNATGFLKIVLAHGGPDSWKLRLHVWEDKEQKEFPHNHKWDFCSKIVSGYLTQDIYEKRTSSSATCTLSSYSTKEPVSLMPTLDDGTLPCPCRDEYMLATKDETNESVTLTKVAQDHIAAGEVYGMGHEVIHTINPSRGALSLVFTSSKVRDNSEVFVPNDMLTTDLIRHAPSVTQDELVRELVSVKHLLGQLHVKNQYLPEIVDSERSYYSKDVVAQFNDGSWRTNLLRSNGGKRVKQFSLQERKNYRVTADKDGRVQIGGRTADSSHSYLFTLFNDALYATPKDFHHVSDELVCHTSFTDYGPVDAAGVFQCSDDGTIQVLEAYSGHYEPSIDEMEFTLAFAEQIGLKVDEAVLRTYQERV